MSYDAFFSALHAKLEAGAREYGDRSFSRPVIELLDELQAECLDLAGWGYILWTKLDRIKKQLDSDLDCLGESNASR